MSGDNDGWLSTACPPKSLQKSAEAKLQANRGRGLPPSKPTVNLMSRRPLPLYLTQNSPPPRQLKSAKRQSSLRDFFPLKCDSVEKSKTGNVKVPNASLVSHPFSKPPQESSLNGHFVSSDETKNSSFVDVPVVESRVKRRATYDLSKLPLNSSHGECYNCCVKQSEVHETIETSKCCCHCQDVQHLPGCDCHKENLLPWCQQKNSQVTADFQKEDNSHVTADFQKDDGHSSKTSSLQAGTSGCLCSQNDISNSRVSDQIVTVETSACRTRDLSMREANLSSKLKRIEETNRTLSEPTYSASDLCHNSFLTLGKPSLKLATSKTTSMSLIADQSQACIAKNEKDKTCCNLQCPPLSSHVKTRLPRSSSCEGLFEESQSSQQSLQGELHVAALCTEGSIDFSDNPADKDSVTKTDKVNVTGIETCKASDEPASQCSLEFSASVFTELSSPLSEDTDRSSMFSQLDKDEQFQRQKEKYKQDMGTLAFSESQTW